MGFGNLYFRENGFWEFGPSGKCTVIDSSVRIGDGIFFAIIISYNHMYRVPTVLGNLQSLITVLKSIDFIRKPIIMK